MVRPERHATTPAFDRTPVFLGCSDVDPHIPLERVHGTAAVFVEWVPASTTHLPGMGHTVANDELRGCCVVGKVAPLVG
jgi:phospholipase/carboxylesterase